VEEDTVKELMKTTGFGYPGGPDRAAHMDNPVTSYSGGWKMKMQLCAAQLMNADVLMLDEPTGHLDVDNIKWLEDWLESFPGSIICTSHFSPFHGGVHVQTHPVFPGAGSTLSAWLEQCSATVHCPQSGKMPPFTHLSQSPSYSAGQVSQVSPSYLFLHVHTHFDFAPSASTLAGVPSKWVPDARSLQ